MNCVYVIWSTLYGHTEYQVHVNSDSLSTHPPLARRSPAAHHPHHSTHPSQPKRLQRIAVKIGEAERGQYKRALAAATDSHQCNVCLAKPNSVVFQCGHQACSACAGRLEICPSCRADITGRINVFS